MALYKKGDKVPNPKTKSVGCSSHKSNILRQADDEEQEYLYVTGIHAPETDMPSYGINNTGENVYSLHLSAIESSGDYFTESDVSGKPREPEGDLLQLVAKLKGV